MNEKYFSEIFGLTTKHDPTTENGGVFFLYYLILKKMNGIGFTDQDRVIFNKKMDNAYVSPGLYLRSKHHTERTVSHDEITGMLFSSFLLETSHAESISEVLAHNYGNYPATGTTKFYNPADFYAWYTVTNRQLSVLFGWIYMINLLISSNKGKQDTSSKLIYLSELYILKDISWFSGLLWKYFSWKMKKMYGDNYVRELFYTYFGRTEEFDHPLIHLSNTENL